MVYTERVQRGHFALVLGVIPGTRFVPVLSAQPLKLEGLNLARVGGRQISECLAKPYGTAGLMRR